MPSISVKLVEPAKLAIIAAMAYVVATTGWFFMVGPEPAPVADVRGGDAAARAAAPGIDDIVALDLFGAGGAAEVEPNVAEMPETRLELELLGVYQAEEPDPSLSAAIVGERNRPGKTYEIGDILPGNAELMRVFADRIVLRRGGVLETLRFPEGIALTSSAAAQDEPDRFEQYLDQAMAGEDDIAAPAVDDTAQYDDPSTSSEGDSGIQSASDFVERYRDRLAEDPAAALDELGVSPVAAGQAQGYQLGALANHPVLRQTGLQPGDVVLSVNGRPVGDIQQDQLEIDNVLAQGSVRLEIQRGGRRFFVTASLQ